MGLFQGPSDLGRSKTCYKEVYIRVRYASLNKVSTVLLVDQSKYHVGITSRLGKVGLELGYTDRTHRGQAPGVGPAA